MPADHASRAWIPDCSKLAITWKTTITSLYVDITSSPSFWRYRVSIVKISYWCKFHVNIITGSGVTTNLFIRDWQEIRESEIQPPEFCSIPGDYGELGLPNFAVMFLMKIQLMLQIVRFTVFTVSALLRENQERVGRG